MKTVFLALISFTAFAAPVTPPFPEKVQIGNHHVPLHGWGTRTATIFGIRVYDAAFYNPVVVQDAKEIITSAYPKRIEIRYTRDVSLEDVKKAWDFQFRDSVPETYESIGGAITLLNSWQTSIRSGDSHRFDLYSNEVRFSINGEMRGAIEGIAFRDSLILLFFGDRPPTKDLKRSLLTHIKKAPAE